MTEQLAFDVYLARPGVAPEHEVGPLPIVAKDIRDAEAQAGALAGVQPERCLALPHHGDLCDEIMAVLERENARADESLRALRELHAKILGCPIEELDARLAAEDAARRAALPPKPAKAPRAGRAGKRAAEGPIGTARLTDRQRALLANLRVESNIAVYVPDERIPDWGALKSVMLALGGAWRSRKAGFVFPDDVDAAELVRLAIATGEILDPKAAEFYPTPTPLADRVAALAAVRPGDRVLEPSAGRGAIALAVRRACPDAIVECVEALPDNRAALAAAGFPVIGEDFLALAPAEPFDAITMNPPFAKRADVRHVERALTLLRPGGALVSIMSAGVEYRDDGLARAFRTRVEDLGGRFESNPDGSFIESGTGVRTVTLVIPRRAA